MKNLLPFLFLALTFSCSNKTAEPTSAKNNHQPNLISEKSAEESEKAEVPYTIEKATKSDFEKAKKNQPAAFTPDTTNSHKKNGILHVKTNGQWKAVEAFRDTLNSPDSDDSDIREYKYLGQYKPINKYLIEGYFWEFYECYLVDKDTRRIDTTWTRPYFSPDNKMLASLSMPYGLEGLPLGIQVFKVESAGQKLNKHIEINQKEWSPYDSYWESPNTIIIQILPVERVLEINGIPKEEDYTYLRLRIK